MNEPTKGCPKCGRILEGDVEICPHCGYKFAEINAYFNKMDEERFNSTGEYAGLLKRLIAILTDMFFVGGFFLIVVSLVLNFLTMNIPNYFYLIIFISIFFAYKVLMEGVSSATIGKKLAGITIVTKSKENIGFKESIIRNIAIIFDFLTAGIGILMVIFTKEDVALHDVIAKTLVINDTEEVLNADYAPGAVRLIAFAIDCALMYGLVYLVSLGFNYITDNYILTMNISEHIKGIEITLDVILVVAYFVCFESGYRKASIGKRMTGIHIETLGDQRMSFFKAFIRTICLLIEIPTLGFLLCTVTNKKQTLKDKIVGTKVTRR